MRDYKKDAQDLRRIARFQNCFECYEGERTEGSCSSRCVLSKAADAIEELLAVVPHWISVEANQKLPVSGFACAVGYFKGGKYGQLYWFDFVSKDKSGVVVPHSTDIEGDCIAVYALPEPPKEDAE